MGRLHLNYRVYRFIVSLTLSCLFVPALRAQYGGPIGGGGIPVPWHHKKNQQKNSQVTEPSITADGKTVSNDGKTLVVATEDGRTLTLKLDPETKFTRSGSDISPSKIIARTTVHVEASEDDQAYLTAIHVELVKDAPPESPQTQAPSPKSGAKEVDEADRVRPTILNSPVDAPDRPILRRGAPKKSSSEDSDSGDVEAANKMASKPAATADASTTRKESTDFTIGDDSGPAKRAHAASQDLIAKTKEWSETFTNGLPNFVCEQFTTRYVEESRSAGWQPLDVISAKVVYEDGKEDYREIEVGGKKTNKSMLELGGSTSTGEFASTLRSLFSDASHADFKFYRSSTTGDTPSSIYDFKVALPNSDWFIKIGGQSLRPAYSGSVWIDHSTAQVRRIEMQADNIPKDFPLDSIEWAVDYDNVRLGVGTFLLPVRAENLSCQRGSSICTKNTVEFRNYHKYSGESTITFDK